ncbi:tetraspanin-13-like isoform X1 [Gigantopelta aegis]|uniref:tetraspanin-13-like isoform X1 n=1 Tax=Gigantopelta aegis TaxID=1735272 RepID=UPI001B887732|nr:tetraspanin-13-like isoform X1 [Gigantopelta aegis]
MVCGGFACSRNSLAALNVLYILVSFILIGVAAYGRLSAIVTSLTLVGSLIACGVFLFFIALTGLIGALKHHQVLLFFYMIILFLLFLLQFSLACACLAFNSEQQQDLVERGWNLSSDATKNDVQNQFQCCGFRDQDLLNGSLGHPPCVKVNLGCCHDSDAICCSGNSNGTKTCPCDKCSEKLQMQIHAAFKVTGGVGLFFSFTEIIGVWLAMRYRNQKDPRANPSAFL